eukprot:CAMPEP_0114668938 /NCGR_PEP_ID=MMETSP0191-20121206/37197_1 /TAXON_ID=126664 /ORGANISM="Sorites sp." /LENGTH=483 /DNA_ID=CAMNT_0001923359 /DNA_START=18 /DNA_END=1469 /DNA_ORIENTATION=-
MGQKTSMLNCYGEGLSKKDRLLTKQLIREEAKQAQDRSIAAHDGNIDEVLTDDDEMDPDIDITNNHIDGINNINSDNNIDVAGDGNTNDDNINADPGTTVDGDGDVTTKGGNIVTITNLKKECGIGNNLILNTQKMISEIEFKLNEVKDSESTNIERENELNQLYNIIFETNKDLSNMTQNLQKILEITKTLPKKPKKKHTKQISDEETFGHNKISTIMDNLNTFERQQTIEREIRHEIIHQTLTTEEKTEHLKDPNGRHGRHGSLIRLDSNHLWTHSEVSKERKDMKKYLKEHIKALTRCDSAKASALMANMDHDEDSDDDDDTAYETDTNGHPTPQQKKLSDKTRKSQHLNIKKLVKKRRKSQKKFTTNETGTMVKVNCDVTYDSNEDVTDNNDNDNDNDNDNISQTHSNDDDDDILIDDETNDEDTASDDDNHLKTSEPHGKLLRNESLLKWSQASITHETLAIVKQMDALKVANTKLYQ